MSAVQIKPPQAQFSFHGVAVKTGKDTHFLCCAAQQTVGQRANLAQNL